MNVTSKQAARVLGVSEKTLREWVLKKLIAPVFKAEVRGHAHIYSLKNIFSLAISRDLKRRGFSLHQAGCALQLLNDMSTSEMQRFWDAGRVFLFVVGDTIQPFPRLMTGDEIFENPKIDLRGAFELGIPVAIVDTKRVYATVRAELENLEREKKQERESVTK